MTAQILISVTWYLYLVIVFLYLVLSTIIYVVSIRRYLNLTGYWKAIAKSNGEDVRGYTTEYVLCIVGSILFPIVYLIVIYILIRDYNKK